MASLVVHKDRLYSILKSGIDAKDTADKCEQVLEELCDIELFFKWITKQYAYKGVDICRAIDETLRPLTHTCQHHKTLGRLDNLLLRATKVGNTYHRAQQVMCSQFA